jgi:Txe/YoeB family toxin of toxin-antitoxin system
MWRTCTTYPLPTFTGAFNLSPFSPLKENPFKKPPPYEKLAGDLSGAYSRRINIQHRLVYQVLEDIKTVKVIRMWTHYEFMCS